MQRERWELGDFTQIYWKLKLHFEVKILRTKAKIGKTKAKS